MFKKSIAVVHSSKTTPTYMLKCLDSPKHRERIGNSREILISGWIVLKQPHTSMTLHFKTENAMGSIPVNICRPDVVSHIYKTTKYEVDTNCGFSFAIEIFSEMEIWAQLGSGKQIPLYSISILSFDLISGEHDDSLFLHPEVPTPVKIFHSNFWNYLAEIGNIEGKDILEIGSRAVTGSGKGLKGNERFCNANYTGFDYYPGENVDIVGDAHRLSMYFEKKFDIVISFAVFEHLAMPWIVACEIAKVLKIGGIVAIETHFSYSSHERPWHFFQFSDMGLRALFSPQLGFECLDSGMSNPMVGRFSNLSDSYLQNKPVTGLYCHSAILAKKVRESTLFPWSADDIDMITGHTVYPKQIE